MMKAVRFFACACVFLAFASCSIFEPTKDSYGYSWMTVNDVAFGMGAVDEPNALVEGLACRIQGNRSLYSELEFRYLVYHDANDDNQFQSSEVLAEDRKAFAAGAEEVHIQPVLLKNGSDNIRISVAAYDRDRLLASYEGGFTF